MLFVPRNTERVIPSWFTRSLVDIDPNLICYWNPMRNRFVIDRCTRNGDMSAAAHTHTAECPRINVMVVQDDAKQYMPLCEQVLDTLRSRDAWSQFGSTENYLKHSNKMHADAQAAEARAVDDLYREASADNRRQLNEAYTITQMHNLV